ncbi:YcxB family protein [Pseudoalteromonas byunsanensis]|uniref:YcxB-like C-terminal domain-containing protein n=1 Tax=Pseudoalteromonas byunsanensis TaxID=327939 RepID=A0A1S1N346_9GAMM|nr:YcxB family protein [Pseudoalteromonas byunsanensis]OHU95614.1 hypothetical protein BIW53_10370 [Pseudoalteromonas byunsanensis]
MFTEKFTLDREYFRECFDESLPLSDRAKPKYSLLVFLIVLAVLSWVVVNNQYLASFLALMAVLEVIAFIYRKPWWVARQMISRAAGSLVVLHIDDEGIKAVNPYKQYQFLWHEIIQAQQTDKGIVLKTKRGMQYISQAAISKQAFDFILEKTKI